MPRTNYAAIINGLADDRFITASVREASLKLHSTFMSYKPRNRKIPDSAVGSLMALDKLLELELGRAIPEESAELTPITVENKSVPAV